ncbi:MAG: transglutaminase-like cysteine peptidase [Burkholderiales bacterium]
MATPQTYALSRDSLRPPSYRIKKLALGAFFAAAAIGAAEHGFTRVVTEGLVTHMAQRFGVDARPRLGGWVEFARGETRRASSSGLMTVALVSNGSNAGGITLATDATNTMGSASSGSNAGTNTMFNAEALQRVNSYLNRVPYKDDIAHWKAEDYWATPAEMVASNGGDCEDYAIAKYFLLKELGVPLSRLRMVYVRAGRTAQAHMVLAYYPQPNAEPLILDNLEDRVRAASNRPDLSPVYSFNEDDVVLAATGARTTPQQIRAWRAVLDRLQREAVL